MILFCAAVIICSELCGFIRWSSENGWVYFRQMNASAKAGGGGRKSPEQRVIVKNVCLYRFHLAAVGRRMKEQDIPRSEAIRQAIRDAEMGGRGLGAIPLGRQILSALERLRRHLPSPTPGSAEALSTIEQLARQIVDG